MIKEKAFVSLMRTKFGTLGNFIVEINNEICVFYFLAEENRFDELEQVMNKMNERKSLEIGVEGNRLCRMIIENDGKETIELMPETKIPQNLYGLSGHIDNLTGMKIGFSHGQASVFIFLFVEEESLRPYVFTIVKPFEAFEYWDKMFNEASGKKIDLTAFGDKVLDVIIDKDNHFEI